MEEITFMYKNIKTKIKFNENEIIGDIFKKCADQLKKNIDEIYFKYNDKLINKDLIIKDIIKDKKSDTNIIYIFVYDINKKNEKEKILKEEEISLIKKNETGNICNYIIAEFEIGDYKKTRILNSFESWENEDKIKTETIFYENENEIKNKIVIQINDNIIPFTYFYDFKKPGEYIIKYIFKNLLTKTVCLFADCTSLKKVDLSNFNTEKVTNMNSTFRGCKLLNEINLTNINTKNVTDMCRMFYGCESLINIDVSKFNTEKVTKMIGLFYECKSLKNLDVSKFNTKNVTDMKALFYGCKSLNNIDVSKFNTKKVTNMNGLFYECESLKNIDVSKFNTEKVTNMNGLFFRCKSLNNIDVSKFNTENVTNMGGIFRLCESLKNIDVSKFNTENVTDMCSMFYGCESLKNIDVSKFNTEKVTNMNGLFYDCESLKNIDVSKFNTENVTNMGCMLYGCKSLNNIDVSKFNTEKVTNMNGLFYECESLKYLDLSKFNTKNVTDMGCMFYGCTLLKDINVKAFIVTKNVDYTYMFNKCYSFPDADIVLNRTKYEYYNLINNNKVINLSMNQEINEYNNKINYIFIKEPNLKYKLNTHYGDKFTIFEIYTSCIDSKDYIAFSDDSDNTNLKIFYFYENKLKTKVSFPGRVQKIKYYINKNNYNEYLLIKHGYGDSVVHITNNYLNIYNSKYYSLLGDVSLVFPYKNDIYFAVSKRVHVEGYYSDESYFYEETKAESLISGIILNTEM